MSSHTRSSAQQSLLDEGNICGQTLVRLVSRGNAIIAELNRLCDHIPSAFLPNSRERQYDRYRSILFDARYLNDPDAFNQTISESTELSDLDEELQQSCEDILSRFFQLFESMCKYYRNYLKFLDDLENGFYIHLTMESVILDPDGKQLMCEGLYLLGCILLLLDDKIPGKTREYMLTTHYRWQGESTEVDIEDLARLLRDTGYQPGEKPPNNYPEVYFERFPVPSRVTHKLIDRLRSDDVYHQIRIYPDPLHRSVALSRQASLLYVILYFEPQVLDEEFTMMREITDKHFGDNWVIPVYMGYLADLSVEWKAHKAAFDALNSTALNSKNVRDWTKSHNDMLRKYAEEINSLLVEGAMTDEYVIDNISKITDVLRRANIALRWLLLHQ